MILLIDNDDSFTYNVVELLKKVTDEPVTVRSALYLLQGGEVAFVNIGFREGGVEVFYR